MSDKVLFVDDNENVLNAFKRQLRNKYEMHTATSGREGLQIVQKKGPFSVVVSDMKMPEMDGIEFLKELKKLDKACMRIMLTGNADQETAIAAVNKGSVFRFLNKPSSVQELTEAIDDAITQYQIQQTERRLLKETLNGSVKAMADILSLVVPVGVTADPEVVNMAVEVSRVLQGENQWEMEIAIRLSRVAYITLPDGVLAKIESGQGLDQSERRVLDNMPEIGYRLLSNIPRLESVANIIRFQNKNFDGSGMPDVAVSGSRIPLESRILKVLHSVEDMRRAQHISAMDALEKMKDQSNFYDPNVLQTVTWYYSAGEEDAVITMTRGVNVRDLVPGMKLVSNVTSMDGTLLFSSGHTLTEAIVEKLVAHHHIHKIREPIEVSGPVESDAMPRPVEVESLLN